MTAGFIYCNDTESHQVPSAVPARVREHPFPDDAPRKPGGNGNVRILCT